LAEKLAHYVYLLIDPRDGVIFYVGKGINDRCLQHGPNDDLGDKSTRLAELKASGLEPRIEILRHGLETAAEALLIEATAIDLLGLGKLTNIQPGHRSVEYGRTTLAELAVRYMPEDAEIRHKVIFLKLALTYRKGMPPEALYEVARGVWPFNPDCANAYDYALCVHEGIVVEVFRTHRWQKSDSAHYPNRKDLVPSDFDTTCEFVGELAEPAIRSHYIGKSVRKNFAAGGLVFCKYGPKV
jgi:hypothetical protein